MVGELLNVIGTWLYYEQYVGKWHCDANNLPACPLLVQPMVYPRLLEGPIRSLNAPLPWLQLLRKNHFFTMRVSECIGVIRGSWFNISPNSAPMVLIFCSWDEHI